MHSSHLGILSATNKTLMVYDANVNQVLAEFDDQHGKMIHGLDFYKSAADQSLNLFTTCASDNTL